MKLNERVSHKANFINPCLTLEEQENDDMESKIDCIKFTLKVKATATGTNLEKYQLYVKRFDKGSPREYITMQIALAEIHLQNSVMSATDHVATVRTILKGETTATYNAKIFKLCQQTDNNGQDIEPASLTTVHVKEGLKEVVKTVLSHRLLEIQKTWMQHVMKKPWDMKFWKFSNAVAKLNSVFTYAQK